MSEEGLIQVEAGGIPLYGNLLIPDEAKGLVLFAHGSGSSRISARNQYVARQLRADGMATLLFDLLTCQEEAEDQVTARLRFDIDLLSRRLADATDWAESDQRTKHLKIGYFGASTGAAAALVAAAEKSDSIGAVVSRGGRPDLAASCLGRVSAPTLLIVGGNDPTVIELNRQALEQLNVEKQMKIVPCATHLFAEPGALEQVADLAGDWFARHLSGE